MHMQSFSLRSKTPKQEHPPEERDTAIRLRVLTSAPPLGSMRSGRFELSLDGELVREVWLAVPMAFPFLTLDVFAFLPGEFRAIIHDTSVSGSTDAAVAWFMRVSADHIRTLRGAAVSEVWKESCLTQIATHEDLFQERMDILLRVKI